VSRAEQWLRDHLAAAPEGLLGEMVAALPAGEDTVPEALAAGALALYGRVLRGGGGREDALPLLAADALLTHAFEAQAELDPGIAGFAARWGAAGRLGELAA
jgi:hypothetical protein